MALLSVALSQARDGNFEATATSIDAAYADAELGQLQGKKREAVVNVGANIADARGNTIDIAKWAARAAISAVSPQDAPKN
jgi:hypothetical protein